MKEQHSIPKFDKSNYQLPEGYFEGLDDQIMQKIQDPSTQKQRTIRPMWPAIALAAALFISFGIWWINSKHFNNVQSVPTLSAEDIIYSGELEDYAFSQDQLVLAAVEDLPFVLGEEVSKDDIAQYLISEEITEYEIYNYLDNN